MNTTTQPAELPATNQFRKKPVVIEAIQWDGTESGIQRIKACFPAMNTVAKTGHLKRDEVTYWRIETLEGGHVVSNGDWVIKGIKGEFYPCKPDIFAATYESAAALAPTGAALSDEQLTEAGRAWVFSVSTGNGPDFAAMRAALTASAAQQDACQTCGSDCNERDELVKAEREIERLRAAQTAVVPTREDLIAALTFYAERGHFGISDEDAWDTVSGEPQNYWCDEAGTATVEDGTLAKLTLAGEMTAEHFAALNAEDATPSTGESQG